MAGCKEQTCDLMPGICCLECELAPMCTTACELPQMGIEVPEECSAYKKDVMEQLTIEDLLGGGGSNDGKT